METEKELNAKIIELKTEIGEKHPEIAKLLTEMPVTIPNEIDPQINVKQLKEYYDSLIAIVKKHNL